MTTLDYIHCIQCPILAEEIVSTKFIQYACSYINVQKMTNMQIFVYGYFIAVSPLLESMWCPKYFKNYKPKRKNIKIYWTRLLTYKWYFILFLHLFSNFINFINMRRSILCRIYSIYFPKLISLIQFVCGSQVCHFFYV